MTGRTPAEAVRNFLAPLQRALSCVSTAVLVHDGHDPGREHTLRLSDRSTSLQAHPRLWLRIFHQFVLQREEQVGSNSWRVSTTGYLYAVDDEIRREILAYHWDPETSSTRLPHLHLGPAAEVGRELLHRAHLYTGRVAIEDVLLLLVEEFGVKPLREDWRAVLDASRLQFVQSRTWA